MHHFHFKPPNVMPYNTSKEETLLKFYTQEMSEPYGKVPFDVIYQAMDEYAKQQSIGFSEWLEGYKWHDFKEFYEMEEKIGALNITKEHLYTIYLNSIH